MVRSHPRTVVSTALLILAALWASSCAVPLGPVYTIEKQSVTVHFVSEPEPHLEVSADFRVINSGNQLLEGLEVELPDLRFYDTSNLQIQLDQQDWTARALNDGVNGRKKILFEAPWRQKARHELTLRYELSRGITRSALVAFAAEDAFYLSPGGWYPVLQAPSGTFAELRGPQKKWDFTLRLPAAFRVRASGRDRGKKMQGNEFVERFEQQEDSLLPFAVAGRYEEREIVAHGQSVMIWTRHPYAESDAQTTAAHAARVLLAYDDLFGPRSKRTSPVWLVDCPCSDRRTVGLSIPQGAYASTLSTYGPFPDMVILEESALAAGVDPFLARQLVPSWLGLGQIQSRQQAEMPMERLDAYAAILAELPAELHAGRDAEIADLLRQFDAGQALEASQKGEDPGVRNGLKQPEKENAFKDLLFFFGLEDRFGQEHLHAALKHMVQARRALGYNLADLIAALEQETHRNVAEFARLWLKHPGIPEDFRERYAMIAAGPAPAAATSQSKETTP